MKAETTAKLLERFSRARVLVVGDFLLDEFVLGDISRVSREAPVLILRYANSDFRPGGAANTVANVHALGAQVRPLGFIGEDESGRMLLNCWSSRIDASLVMPQSDLRTTRKVRILAGSFQSFRQQVVRLDYEWPLTLSAGQEETLCGRLTEVMPECDAVILSDYSLGNLSERVRRTAIETARSLGKPLAVDSRDRSELFAGATTLTPNVSELERALDVRLGEDEELLEQTAEACRRRWDLEALLVTRGRLGLSLIHSGGALHIPPYGEGEVADVTGAGDTVVATYTVALAAGADFPQAARLANRAGGLAVCKRGTATISRAELLATFSSPE
ncbi:MAG TPA: PfkB family carbohydrate kinase [Acidobacteriota bacterium]|nr:PfkB family carbohydrate kinase [Acidobacteriota bacterium]